MKQVLIVIPARYQSSRLPGKPLIKIADIEMVKRVANIAAYLCQKNDACSYVVATDDSRILNFCQKEGIPAVMTSPECKSGTERCWDSVCQQTIAPELIINLQGDNPLCPPHLIQSIIDNGRSVPADVFTPCVVLSWAEYARLVESKKSTPYSGTTVLVDKSGYALAFSKNIIPAIRDESKAQSRMPTSPVRRHIGLYAYTYNALKTYLELPPSVYEQNCIEGLEQMRFLENEMKIKIIEVDYRGRKTTSGVDSPEDIIRVEKILAEYGEFDLSL